jgi:hypothetical protein
MENAKSAVDKLRRIQELWFALEHTHADTPEYASLIKQIHILSEEYAAITNSLPNRLDKDSN